LDQPHHFADLLCRLQQAFHHGIGAVGLGNRALRDRCRVSNLTGDFLPRCRKFLRRSSHGLHIRRGLFRGCGDGGALPCRLLRDGGQRLRRALHFGGGRSGPGDNSADTFLELARDPVHGRFPFRHGARRRLLPLCAQTFGIHQPILENGQAA